MSRRVSARVKRKTSLLQESEQQPASRRRRVEQHEEHAQANHPPSQTSPSHAGMEEMIERVTNAVLEKLQTKSIDNTTAGNENLLLPGTASAVQGSVVAEPGIRLLSGVHVNENTPEIVNTSDQANTSAAIVQGSIAAVLDGLSGSNSLISKILDCS